MRHHRWPLVQWQDTGLWIREWWFEPTGANPHQEKSGRGGLTPARAAFSQPTNYGLGWSGFVSFASLTSRSAARSASFASDSDRPRLWSVWPMLLPLFKPSRMAVIVMAGFLVPRFLASTFAAMNWPRVSFGFAVRAASNWSSRSLAGMPSLDAMPPKLFSALASVLGPPAGWLWGPVVGCAGGVWAAGACA